MKVGSRNGFTFMAKFDLRILNILAQFSTSNIINFGLTVKEKLCIQHPKWKRKGNSDSVKTQMPFLPFIEEK